MTSNVGASRISAKRIGFDVQNDSSKDYENMKDDMMDALKDTFRPEFLNRVDDIIVFTKLTEEDTENIAELMLGSVAKRLTEHGVKIKWDKDVVAFMAKEGISDEYGARPLRRMIQQSVEDKLSEEILESRISLGDEVEMKIENDEVVFKKAETEETLPETKDAPLPVAEEVSEN